MRRGKKKKEMKERKLTLPTSHFFPSPIKPVSTPDKITLSSLFASVAVSSLYTAGSALGTILICRYTAPSPNTDRAATQRMLLSMRTRSAIPVGASPGPVSVFTPGTGFLRLEGPRGIVI